MRLIDLHCNWLRQYFSELTSFDGSADADVSNCLGQVDGYLSDTSAAALICARAPADWVAVADPWAKLAEMIARYQAEFSGRILMGPDDTERWVRELADGLCWGLIGIQGFDYLIRNEADLDQLPELFARGARMFQPIETSHTSLGGSDSPGDDRGLTELGRLFLERLVELVPSSDTPKNRPIVDVARMNSATVADVLNWVEADSRRPDQILLVVSHGAVARPGSSLDNVRRLRALGGVIGLSVGPPYIGDSDDLLAQVRTLEAIPFQGREGVAGIAIGTDFLGGVGTLDGLKTVEKILNWLRQTFDKPTSQALAFGSARNLFLKAAAGK